MHVEPGQIRQPAKWAYIRDRILADDELGQVRESAQWADVTDPVGVEAKHSEFGEFTKRADICDQPIHEAEAGQVGEILDSLETFERLGGRRSQRASVDDALTIRGCGQCRQLR